VVGKKPRQVVESISVNKELGIALRILNCPSENIDGESSTLIIGCRTCIQGRVFFNREGVWRMEDCAEIRWLDSPEISTTNFSMFALRNCLLRTMPRELKKGNRVKFSFKLLSEEGSAQAHCGSGRF